MMSSETGFWIGKDGKIYKPELENLPGGVPGNGTDRSELGSMYAGLLPKFLEGVAEDFVQAAPALVPSTIVTKQVAGYVTTGNVDLKQAAADAMGATPGGAVGKTAGAIVGQVKSGDYKGAAQSAGDVVVPSAPVTRALAQGDTDQAAKETGRLTIRALLALVTARILSAVPTTGPSGASPAPNAGALNLYRNRAFLRLVRNRTVDCSQVANELHEASGNVGRQITINPGPGSDTVRYPTSRGPDVARYHTVYTDGHYVFDPRYRLNPIPLAEWEAEVERLNPGENVFGR